MSELAELTTRVTKLEREMADVRNLAGGASTEVGDVNERLRAHTKSLEALRTTQVEQGKEMREGFARVESRFAKVEGDMREGFAQVRKEMSGGLEQVREEMSGGLEQVRKEMSGGLEQVRKEMSEGLEQVRKEMRDGDAGLRKEMREGFAQVRGEMGEGFAMLKRAIEKSDES